MTRFPLSQVDLTELHATPTKSHISAQKPSRMFKNYVKKKLKIKIEK